MIEKITDLRFLSGVSSPLLPLIYADGVYSQKELDGAFVQKAEDDEIQAVFSLKNTCVTLAMLNNSGIDELVKFYHFCGVTEILSDKDIMPFCKEQVTLNLLEFSGHCEEGNNYLTLSSQSKLSDYQDVYNLVFEKGNGFENWFPEFSKKINAAEAFAVYLRLADRVVSAAVAPAVYENKGVIAGVLTMADYRNRGYAGECVKALLSEMNVSQAYLWCENNNLKFYENLGFKNTGKIYLGECN